MLVQCEMIELHLADKKCSKRTNIIADWCDVCRIRKMQNE